MIGEDGLEIYNSFTLTEIEKNSLEHIKRKFREHCSPQKNIIFERFVFNSIIQKEDQTFDNFLTELRKAVKTTEYPDSFDMIRDRIVMGILDKVTQEKFLREKNLTLEKTINLCRAIEASKSQVKALQTEVSVNAMYSRKKKDGKTNQQKKP